MRQVQCYGLSPGFTVWAQRKQTNLPSLYASIGRDHEQLRHLAEETLLSQGYQVISAVNGLEAVRRFQENSNEISLALLDIVMPILSGPDAYCQISAIRPDLLVIFTSGHTGGEVASVTDKAEDGAIFLQKPYSPQTLSHAVRSTLDRKRG